MNSLASNMWQGVVFIDHNYADADTNNNNDSVAQLH